MTVQDDIHTAFQWVCRVYDEGRALLSDASQAFNERGLAVTSTQLAYATTLRETSANQDDYPFVYCAAQFHYTSEEETADDGTAVFIAISFHDKKRRGPTLLAGIVRWNNRSAKLDHWLVNATARAPGWRGTFSQQSDGVITLHTPTAQALKLHPGIVSVSSVEIPLTRIDGQERLRSLVDALVAMRDGSDDDIRKFVAEQSI